MQEAPFGPCNCRKHSLLKKCKEAAVYKNAKVSMRPVTIERDSATPRLPLPRARACAKEKEEAGGA